MTEPVGVLSLALVNFERMLSESSAFQGLVGAGDPTEALLSIHLDALETPGGGKFTRAEIEAARPFALLSLADEKTRSAFAQDATMSGDAIAEAGEGASYERSYSVVMDLEQNAPSGESYRESALLWRNSVGGILGDFEAFSRRGGFFAIDSYRLLNWGRVHPDSVVGMGDFQRARVLCQSVGL